MGNGKEMKYPIKFSTMIQNPYYYLFYRLYKRQRTKFGEFESVYFTIATISALFFINIYTLQILLAKLNIIPEYINSVAKGISIILILIVMNFFCFFYKKKYKSIEFKFDNYRKIKFGVGWIIIYVVLSFIAFFYVVNFKT